MVKTLFRNEDNSNTSGGKNKNFLSKLAESFAVLKSIQRWEIPLEQIPV